MPDGKIKASALRETGFCQPWLKWQVDVPVKRLPVPKDTIEDAQEMRAKILVDDINDIVVIKTPWPNYKPFIFMQYKHVMGNTHVIKRYQTFYKIERIKKRKEEAKHRGCIYCGLYYEEGCSCGWRDW